MPEIRLTQFMNFVFASAVDKPEKVRQMRDVEYNRVADLYAPLRAAIIAYNGTPQRRAAIVSAAAGVRGHGGSAVRSAAASFVDWLALRNPQPFRGVSETMRIGGLTVRVNPEIGMTWGGRSYLLKLLFPAPDPPTRLRHTITYLMQKALGEQVNQGLLPRVFHVHTATVYRSPRNFDGFQAALAYEANMLVQMWNSL